MSSKQPSEPVRTWMVVLVAVTALAAAMLFSAPAQAGTVSVPLDDALTDINKCGVICQEAPSSFSCSANCQVRRPDGGTMAEVSVGATGSTPTACLTTLRTACRNLLGQ